MKDIYLKFTKKTNSKAIPGESLDPEHREWIEVDSWTQPIFQPTSATASTAGGHSVERCEHHPMVLSKDLDKASVYMYEACSAGYTYDVEIHFLRASGTVRTTYLVIKLSDAILSSIDTHVHASGLPQENFTLRYSKVVWEHKGSKADGSANVGRDVAGWDLAGNKVAA